MVQLSLSGTFWGSTLCNIMDSACVWYSFTIYASMWAVKIHQHGFLALCFGPFVLKNISCTLRIKHHTNTLIYRERHRVFIFLFYHLLSHTTLSFFFSILFIGCLLFDLYILLEICQKLMNFPSVKLNTSLTCEFTDG